jgi:hypothetical protein
MKNPKQCYSISADIREHILFLGVVQVVSFVREFRKQEYISVCTVAYLKIS